MTLPIEEQGGMTAGDIKALVMASDALMAEQWEQKLNRQTEALLRQLEDHRKHQWIKLDGFMGQLCEWHNTDVAFREQAEREIAALRKSHEEATSSQAEIVKTVRSINWLVRTTACARRVVVESLVVSEDAQKVRHWIHAILLGWLAFWELMHTALPAIRFSLAHHRISF